MKNRFLIHPLIFVVSGIFSTCSMFVFGGLVVTVEHDGHTYQIYDDARTWQQADVFASGVTFGGETGYLVEIGNAAENTAIFRALAANDAAFTRAAADGGGARYVWIGASDGTTEGRWIWARNETHFWQGGKSGSSIGGLYNRWGTTGSRNEPDNFREQNAAAIALDNWPVPSGSLGSASQWNDIDEANQMPCIVEFDIDQAGIAAMQYEIWAAAFGLVGDDALSTADSDSDGLNQLVEYAFGSNPTLPSGESERLPRVQIVSDPNQVEFTYRRRIDASIRGLTYSVSTSTTLLVDSWSGVVPISEEVTPLDAGFEAVKLIIDLTSGGEPNFLRVEVDLR